MEEEKINAIKAQYESKSVQNIRVFIKFANFNWRFIQGFSKIIAPLIFMLKVSSQPANALLATCVDNSQVVGSICRNNRKLVKSDFTKLMRRAEKPSFLTFDAR